MLINIGEKLSYLHETKQQFRTAINAKGGTLTLTTPFRRYVDQINSFQIVPQDVPFSSCSANRLYIQIYFSKTFDLSISDFQIINSKNNFEYTITQVTTNGNYKYVYYTTTGLGPDEISFKISKSGYNDFIKTAVTINKYEFTPTGATPYIFNYQGYGAEIDLQSVNFELTTNISTNSVKILNSSNSTQSIKEVLLIKNKLRIITSNPLPNGTYTVQLLTDNNGSLGGVSYSITINVTAPTPKTSETGSGIVAAQFIYNFEQLKAVITASTLSYTDYYIVNNIVWTEALTWVAKSTEVKLHPYKQDIKFIHTASINCLTFNNTGFKFSLGTTADTTYKFIIESLSTYNFIYVSSASAITSADKIYIQNLEVQNSKCGVTLYFYSSNPTYTINRLAYNNCYFSSSYILYLYYSVINLNEFSIENCAGSNSLTNIIGNYLSSSSTIFKNIYIKNNSFSDKVVFQCSSYENNPVIIQTGGIVNSDIAFKMTIDYNTKSFYVSFQFLGTFNANSRIKLRPYTSNGIEYVNGFQVMKTFPTDINWTCFSVVQDEIGYYIKNGILTIDDPSASNYQAELDRWTQLKSTIEAATGAITVNLDDAKYVINSTIQVKQQVTFNVKPNTAFYYSSIFKETAFSFLKQCIINNNKLKIEYRGTKKLSIITAGNSSAINIIFQNLHLIGNSLSQLNNSSNSAISFKDSIFEECSAIPACGYGYTNFINCKFYDCDFAYYDYYSRLNFIKSEFFNVDPNAATFRNPENGRQTHKIIDCTIGKTTKLFGNTLKKRERLAYYNGSTLKNINTVLQVNEFKNMTLINSNITLHKNSIMQFSDYNVSKINSIVNYDGIFLVHSKTPVPTTNIKLSRSSYIKGDIVLVGSVDLTNYAAKIELENSLWKIDNTGKLILKTDDVPNTTAIIDKTISTEQELKDAVIEYNASISKRYRVKVTADITLTTTTNIENETENSIFELYADSVKTISGDGKICYGSKSYSYSTIAQRDVDCPILIFSKINMQAKFNDDSWYNFNPITRCFIAENCTFAQKFTVYFVSGYLILNNCVITTSLASDSGTNTLGKIVCNSCTITTLSIYDNYVYSIVLKDCTFPSTLTALTISFGILELDNPTISATKLTLTIPTQNDRIIIKNLNTTKLTLKSNIAVDIHPLITVENLNQALTLENTTVGTQISDTLTKATWEKITMPSGQWINHAYGYVVSTNPGSWV